MDHAPPSTPRRGRPPVLDLDKIVTTAAGMDPSRLTMTSVAAELGVTTPALYRWVSDRDTLLSLVSARMAERILPAGRPDPATWREWLTEWAHNLRRECETAPGFAVRLLTGPHRAENHIEFEHRATAAFIAAGIDPADAPQYWYAFSAAVLGWIAADQSHNFPSTTPMDFDTLLRMLLQGTVPGPGRPAAS